MSTYHALVRGIPPTTCSKYHNGNNQPSAHSHTFLGYRHTSGNSKKCFQRKPPSKEGTKNDITVAGNTDLSLRLQFETAIALWQCRMIIMMWFQYVDSELDTGQVMCMRIRTGGSSKSVTTPIEAHSPVKITENRTLGHMPSNQSLCLCAVA